MKTRGRPKLPLGQAREKLVLFRMAPHEADEIDHAARQANQSKSEWIRAALLKAARAGEGTKAASAPLQVSVIGFADEAFVD